MKYVMVNFLKAAFLVFFSLGIISSTFSQINECTNVMSAGSQPCFSFTLEGASERMASNAFQSFVRSEYRTRVRRDRRADEFVASGVNVMSIDATNELNIFGKFNEAGGAVSVTVWFQMGNDFLSTEKYPTKREGLFLFMENLKTEIRKAKIEEILSEQENELNALERQLRRLKRDKDGYEKDIRDAEKKIEESRANIQKNLEEQKETEVTIQRQRDHIEQTRRQLRELE